MFYFTIKGFSFKLFILFSVVKSLIVSHQVIIIRCSIDCNHFRSHHDSYVSITIFKKNWHENYLNKPLSHSIIIILKVCIYLADDWSIKVYIFSRMLYVLYITSADWYVTSLVLKRKVYMSVSVLLLPDYMYLHPFTCGQFISPK